MVCSERLTRGGPIWRAASHGWPAVWWKPCMTTMSAGPKASLLRRTGATWLREGVTDMNRRRSSVAEQGTHKPLVVGSNPTAGARPQLATLCSEGPTDATSRPFCCQVHTVCESPARELRWISCSPHTYTWTCPVRSAIIEGQHSEGRLRLCGPILSHILARVETRVPGVRPPCSLEDRRSKVGYSAQTLRGCLVYIVCRSRRNGLRLDEHDAGPFMRSRGMACHCVMTQNALYYSDSHDSLRHSDS